MSLQKGNLQKQRPPKHKNTVAFKNDKYGATEKMKAVNNMTVSNVCLRCKDIIEWKIKYKKYKPLTVPGTCRKCNLKKVKQAYHVLCSECAVASNACAKCSKENEVVGPPELSPSEKQREENYLKERLKHMKLRERKTFLRQVERDKAKADSEHASDSRKASSSTSSGEDCESIGDNDDIDEDDRVSLGVEVDEIKCDSRSHVVSDSSADAFAISVTNEVRTDSD